MMKISCRTWTKNRGEFSHIKILPFAHQDSYRLEANTAPVFVTREVFPSERRLRRPNDLITPLFYGAICTATHLPSSTFSRSVVKHQAAVIRDDSSMLQAAAGWMEFRVSPKPLRSCAQICGSRSIEIIPPFARKLSSVTFWCMRWHQT